MGGDDSRKQQLTRTLASRAEFKLLANWQPACHRGCISKCESELREEGIGGVVGKCGMCASSIYEDCGRKICVKFIEIESGASHPPARGASVSDALSEVGRGFY